MRNLVFFLVLILLDMAALADRTASPTAGHRWRIPASADRIQGRSMSRHLTDRYPGFVPAGEYIRVSLRFGSDQDPTVFGDTGILVVAGEQKRWDVFVPSDSAEVILSGLADLDEVRKIMRPVPHTIDGEQIGLFQAPLYVTNGFDGSGVKVAVIDGGFYGYDTAIASGELPSGLHARSFAASGVGDFDDADSIHGTAVAEIIHETAPNAELFLLKIDSAETLKKAMNYCVDNGIRIVNHSMGWYNDGWTAADSYIYGDVALPFYESGGLWINSAGNDAQRHYQSRFTPYSSTAYHDFGGRDYGVITNVSSGQTIVLYLNWNAFQDKMEGRSFVDYDLELYRPNGTFLDSSVNSQPDDWPIESLSIAAPVLGTYRYKIKKINSEPDKEFQVFSVYFNIHPVTSSNSLAMPNEGARVLTVGAVHRTNWSKPAAQVRVEPYSSRGPSKTGRCKPDLVGVDGMTNAAYGHFPGTSAASPSVAGLAALILSKQPYLSAYQLRYSLVDNCVDIWTNGPDNETGAGRPVLSLFPLRRNSSQIVSNNLIVAPTRVKRGERVYYYGVSASTLIRLRTVSGLLIGEYKADDGVYSTGENFIQLPASGLADGVFVLEFEDASARSPKFYRKIVVEP